jgi:MoxR-like ATPase
MSDLKSQLSKDYLLVEAKPHTFYQLVDLINGLGAEFSTEVDEIVNEVSASCAILENEADDLRQSFNSILEGIRQASKNRPQFELSDEVDSLSGFEHTAGNNFIRLVLAVILDLQAGNSYLLETARKLHTEHIHLFSREQTPTCFQDAQSFAFQYQMHAPTVSDFANGVLKAESCQGKIIAVGCMIADKLDDYYKTLNHRHSVDGIEIHEDPITTDIAMSIYENVDSHGEIQDGKNPNEISMYTLRKAELITKALGVGVLGTFSKEPTKFIEFINLEMNKLWNLSKKLGDYAGGFGDQIRRITRFNGRVNKVPVTKFEQVIIFISDLNPSSVTYKEKTGLLTLEERYSLEFKNETIKHVAHLIRTAAPTKELINYILNRKKELREYNLEENSFFVCKIGSGNAFTGDAPGELKVVPGIKPSVDLSDVIGSGFQEVKDFMRHAIDGAKWFDIFLATSPSKKADKNNVLLVGPPGSGKTQVLRGVASDRNTIGIFAQASDFLTCWKGEQEKNPKRLFEAGLKIQKESKKQVFFLIDEIDTILNDNQGQNAFGGGNLATEFQVLMDGITSYPNLALWGATNHPERIPMALIRRFSKVIIVGELTQENRVALLKQFLAYLPCSPEINDEFLDRASLALRGAVGDVIRKVIDGIWREKMSHFVIKHPKEADKVLELLNSDGERFHPSKFTPEKRQQMFKIISPHVQVEQVDIVKSIDKHVTNIAIQNEIKTAISVYENAKQFLAAMDR